MGWKVLCATLVIGLVAACLRIFDRSMALDDAYNEISVQRQSYGLLLEVANYAAVCAPRCSPETADAAIPQKYARSKAADHIQIQEIRIEFYEGRITKITTTVALAFQ